MEDWGLSLAAVMQMPPKRQAEERVTAWRGSGIWRGAERECRKPGVPAALSTSKVHHLPRIRAAQNTTMQYRSSAGAGIAGRPRSSDLPPWGFALVRIKISLRPWPRSVWGLQAI